MKITRRQLRKIINESINELYTGSMQTNRIDSKERADLSGLRNLVSADIENIWAGLVDILSPIPMEQVKEISDQAAIVTAAYENLEREEQNDKIFPDRHSTSPAYGELNENVSHQVVAAQDTFNAEVSKLIYLIMMAIAGVTMGIILKPVQILKRIGGLFKVTAGKKIQQRASKSIDEIDADDYFERQLANEKYFKSDAYKQHLAQQAEKLKRSRDKKKYQDWLRHKRNVEIDAEDAMMKRFGAGSSRVKTSSVTRDPYSDPDYDQGF